MKTLAFDYEKHRNAQVARLLTAASDFMQSDQFEDALASLKLCEVAAQFLDDDEVQIVLHGMIGTALVLSGEAENSIENFKKRAYLVRKGGDRLKMHESLECVAFALAAAGYYEEAQKICNIPITSKKQAQELIYQKQLWADVNTQSNLFPKPEPAEETHSRKVEISESTTSHPSDTSQQTKPLNRPAPLKLQALRRSKSPLFASFANSASTPSPSQLTPIRKPKSNHDRKTVDFTELWVDVLERVGNLAVDHILDPPSSSVITNILQ
eukprot:TRINITY_DN8334_c0_g1_i3.p1 TRINITY_DN8334_c0_g1~~TRINITY_DN8334_c0_g1_i3.p1  ORF type:complete len:268 (+),score=70.62 TRINITY_DN8334_c0_g1_i3:38-841(+)